MKCESLACSPEQVEDCWVRICSDGSLSDMSNGMNIVSESLPNVSKMESCQPLQFSETCVSLYSPVTLKNTEDLSMWLRAAFPANHFQTPENDSEPTTQETCGQQQSTASASYDPDSHSWKTFQGWLLVDILEPSFQTWSRAGMTRNGEYFPQPKWERRINGIGCGLEPNGETTFHTPNTSGMDGGSNSRRALKKRQEQWLTPSATNIDERSDEALEKRRNYRNGIGRNTTPPGNLAEQVRYGHPVKGMFPTPRSSESGDYQYDRGDHSKPRLTLTGDVKMFPTPTATDFQNRTVITPIKTSSGTIRHLNKAGGQSRAALSAIVNMYPTPTVNDSKNSTLPPSQINHDNLPGAHERAGEKSGARLNPDWVEWLMGWPIGWTNIDPMPIERFEQWQQNTQSGDWWKVEPEDVPRVTDGTTNRVSRLKAIGNGQVPATAATAWILLSGGGENA